MPDRSVTYTFKGSFGNLTAGLTTAGKNVQEFGAKLTALDKNGQQMRAGLTEIGGSAGRVGLAAAAGLAAATKAAIDWESAWAGVMKTTDGTASQMDELEGQLRELARTMPATHEEIAATAEAAGQLGVAREDIADFTETMIQLGETTNLTADEAATSIAQMANVMGTAPEDIDRLGAALVALGNDGASTERDIIQMSQRIAGAGAQIGLAEPEILAISNAVASMGIEAEAGGTAVSTAFTKMAMAVSSGGPKLEKFAEVAGTSTDEFSRLFKEAPADAFAAFTQGLDRINKSGGDVFGTLKEIGLSDIRVSQAMLGMASAGDLLTESLKTGDEAWRQNSALAEEYQKRAETTAAEAQVAWNNIKDAGIEAGTAMLPIVEAVSTAVGGMGSAFGSLPGPLKATTSGLLGVTAILGGGTWFASKAIQGVADTRQALADLGIEAGRAKGALRGVISAGAGLATVATSATLLQTAFESLFDLRLEGGTLTRDLEALSNGQVTQNFEDLYHTFQDIDDLWMAKANPIGWVSNWDPTGAETAQKNIEDIDAALAGMVEGGNAEKAAKAWSELQKIGKDAGKSTKELIDLFPEYGTALANAEVESGKAAGATRDLGAAGETTAGQLSLTDEQLKTITDNANEAAGSFVNLAAGITDGKFSFEDWVSSLEDAGQAIKDLRVNSREALENGVDEGVVQELKNMGTEGALQLKYLATASEAEVERTNKALRKIANQTAKSVEQDVANAQAGLEDVGASVDALDGAKAEPHIGASTAAFEGGKKKVDRALAALNKDKAEPSIDLNDGAFQSAREAASRQLTDLTKPRTVPITASVDLSGAWARLNSFFGAASRGPSVSSANAAEKKRAFGGLVTGPGGPTDDLIPTWLSNREYVIKASAVEKYGVGFFDAVNAERLATGGQPGRKDGKSKGTNFLGFFPEVGLGLNAFIKSLEASKDALDDELSARKSVAEALASSVSGKFTSDLFGNTDIWSAGGSLADAIAALQGDIAGSQAFQSDVASLQALGLSGAALDSLLTQADPATVANIAATASAESVAEFQRLFQQRIEVNAATVTAAQMATGVAQEIATLGAKVDQTNAHLATLTGIQSDIQKTGPSKTGKATAKANNKGAGKASLNMRRG
ncbi:phage tail tape measure protein [Nocardioides sp. BYT-33-1]|uniref:phage tail tape measure protein n=1 Tax=Nocardioides sp. BYT-33-1 TaxID=3416952 RepID=UPI003F52C865